MRQLAPEFLTSFLLSSYADREATRTVLVELGFFYLLVLVGFGLLYFTWKSNARLKEWKEQFERAVANQRGRAFEPQDAAKLYGMF